MDISQTLVVISYRFFCAKHASLGMPPLVVGWIRTYMDNHSFQVCIGDVVSEEAAMLSGIPQNSVLDLFSSWSW